MMDRVHDPNAKTRLSPGAYGFYVQTDVPDEFTAVIKLNKPWAPLLDAFRYIYRVSPQPLVRNLGRRHDRCI